MADLFGFDHPTTPTGRKARAIPGEKAERDKQRKRDQRKTMALMQGRAYKQYKKGTTEEERRKRNIEMKRLKRLEIARAAGRLYKPHDSHVRLWKRYLDRAEKERGRLHDSHVLEFKADGGRYYAWRYKYDQEFNLKERIRTQSRKARKLFPKLDDLMRDAINRGGESKTVLSVCGYSIQQLRMHIERQFSSGMTWKEFLDGSIHIDHIIPKSMFDLSSMDDVVACWALTNLRPMWADENIRKGSRRVSLL